MSETLAPVLGEATVQELRDALRGELLQPGDEQYDEAKRALERRPRRQRAGDESRAVPVRRM